MSKKRIGIGSISLLLVIIALIWSYNLFGFCLGDYISSFLNLPLWSKGDGSQIANTFSIITADKEKGIHYTAYYSLVFVLPALVLSIMYKKHLLATIGKWMAIVFIALLLVSPLLVMI